MPNIRRRSLVAAGLAGAPFAARGQGSWPGGKGTMKLMGRSPGGGTDVMARAMVPYLERYLPGARFVVLNRPGAGAEIGYTALASAPPDGLTLGVVIVPSLQTITIERTPRYRLQDFAFLGSVVDDPGGFFVAPEQRGDGRRLAGKGDMHEPGADQSFEAQHQQVVVGADAGGADRDLVRIRFRMCGELGEAA